MDDLESSRALRGEAVVPSTAYVRWTMYDLGNSRALRANLAKVVVLQAYFFHP